MGPQFFHVLGKKVKYNLLRLDTVYATLSLSYHCQPEISYNLPVQPVSMYPDSCKLIQALFYPSKDYPVSQEKMNGTELGAPNCNFGKEHLSHH